MGIERQITGFGQTEERAPAIEVTMEEAQGLIDYLRGAIDKGEIQAPGHLQGETLDAFIIKMAGEKGLDLTGHQDVWWDPDGETIWLLTDYKVDLFKYWGNLTQSENLRIDPEMVRSALTTYFNYWASQPFQVAG